MQKKTPNKALNLTPRTAAALIASRPLAAQVSLDVSHQGNMKKTFSIISMFSVLFTFAGCDYQLKSAIKNYKGDGVIEYLDAPGILGASGCSIKMPSFDLSADFEKTYSLDGIPANENYTVYLVVKDQLENNLIKQSHFSFQIKEGKKYIRNVSAPLRAFIASEGGGFNKFYYFEQNQTPETNVNVPLGYSELPIAISISYHNVALLSSKDGYLEIRFGGFK